MERVHHSGLLDEGSLLSCLSCRVLVRVAFTFDQSSIDSAIGAGTASSTVSPPSSSSSSPSFLTGAAGEEVVKWRDASLDSTVSYGMRWGPVADPIAGLSLTAVWPFSPQSTWTESAEYSDLDPLHAPDWRLKLHWLEDSSAGQRGEAAGGSDSSAQSPYVAALHALMEVEQRAKLLHSLSEVVGVEAAGTGPTSYSAQQRSAGAPSGSAAVTGTGATLRSSSASPPPLSSSSSSSSSSSPSSSSSSRASPPSSSAMSAIKAVQSSLAAHIESAQLSALYGETPTSDYVDGVMKALMDITEEELVNKTSASSQGEGKGGGGGGGSGAGDEPPLSSLDPPRALCPYGSLLSLLVIHVCRLNEVGWLNVRSVAVLWQEFVNECRYHFEAGLDLPHVSAGELPDYRSCVLHQKLQTLQRCIALQRQRRDYEKRRREGEEDVETREREALQPFASSAPMDDGLADGWQDYDDLKTEPSAEAWRGPMKGQQQPSSSSSTASMGEEVEDEDEEEEGGGDPSSSAVPRGVLHPLRDERLLLSAATAPPSLSYCLASSLRCRSTRQLSPPPLIFSPLVLVLHPVVLLPLSRRVDRPLLVPVSQPCDCRTADELELELDMLARLGDATQAEAIRREKAEMALSSDMQAFKAANPGCCIEDFVRWHSPKDWRKVTARTSPLSHSSQPTEPASTIAQEEGVGAPLLTDPSHASSAAAESMDSAELVGGGVGRLASSDRRRDPRRGELSVRMRHRNNRWQKLWKVSPSSHLHSTPPAALTLGMQQLEVRRPVLEALPC